MVSFYRRIATALYVIPKLTLMEHWKCKPHGLPFAAQEQWSNDHSPCFCLNFPIFFLPEMPVHGISRRPHETDGKGARVHFEDFQFTGRQGMQGRDGVVSRHQATSVWSLQSYLQQVSDEFMLFMFGSGWSRYWANISMLSAFCYSALKPNDCW